MAKIYQRDGISFEEALAVIKQIPLHQLDSDDIAFLKARESYLSEEEVSIYAGKFEEIEMGSSEESGEEKSVRRARAKKE